ncbi:hypothetical protein Lgra_2003 [Legionella gratiana]|uniref:Uncharacterized protein n=1 Tax=Legionella gratiana TaxID=45066 RepID=A0A378JAW6_9GAMM|nr:hypothetical protein [Legionella gratiana]KTD11037.1 hypothetical protein Lgra_2003 [Legionella gratiana]STX44619.1 Uncharacterised protein [Legionella gratiana]
MPKFVKAKDGVVLPPLSFCNTEMPVVDMEGEIRLKSVHYTGLDPNYENDCVIIKKEDRITGLHTGGMSECHALAMIERDDKGEITKIAMLHFAGGLTKERLQDFITHCTNKGFQDNLELVHYPGYSSIGASVAEIERVLHERKFENEQVIQRIYHADSCTDCCVMFNGQIGNSQGFAPFLMDSKSIERRFDFSNSLEIATNNYQRLIDSYKKEPNKSEPLKKLRDTILSDKLLENPANFLEKTRKFIEKAESSPEEKHALYQEYAKDVKKQPYLTTATKIACVALAATIIGIIPAVIIASRYKNEVKELRKSQLETINECLNISSGPR